MREQLSLLLDECEAATGGRDARTIIWLAAQYETLQWLIGERDIAPLSLRTGPADREAVMREDAEASLIVFDPLPAADPAYQTRAQGVDRVLQWALGRTEEPMAWSTDKRRAG